MRKIPDNKKWVEVEANTYALSDKDDIVLLSFRGGDTTVTLHDPMTAKLKEYTIKKCVDVGILTLDAGSATIDLDSTKVIDKQFMSITIYPFRGQGHVSAGWFILGFYEEKLVV